MKTDKQNGCSPLTRLQRRDYIHQAFFVFAKARRDLVPEESWIMTAREFKRAFNIGEEYSEEALVRRCSDSIRDFILEKTI
jgi:hypothetical protein